MNKLSIKLLFLLSVAILFMFHSCIDDRYDLSNISKDVAVGQEMLSIPIGSTKQIFLNELLGEDALLVLDSNQQYSLNIAESLEPISIDIAPEPIEIKEIEIDPFTIDFDYETISDFSLDAMESTSEIKMRDASVDDINLPEISNEHTETKNLDAPVSSPGVEIKEEITIIPDEKIYINYDYELSKNEEIETIHDIYFGDTDQGQLVYLHVDYSNINSLINKSESDQWIRKLQIEFPAEFVLDIDNNSPYELNTSISGNDNIFNVTNVRLDNNEDSVSFSFYIKSKSVEMSSDIDYNEELTYEVVYEIDGVSDDVSFNSFEITTKIDEQLALNYAEVTTDYIPVDDIEPGTIDITATIDGLDDISKINEVFFDPSSVVDIYVNDPDIPLPLSEGNFYFKFSERMTFDIQSSNIGNNGTFNTTTNTLIIPASDFFGAKVSLALYKMDLSSYYPIVGGEINLNEPVDYTSADLELGPERLKTTELDEMEETEEVVIDVPESYLIVDDAEVVTSKITSSFEEISAIDIDEEVPEELVANTLLIFDENQKENMHIEISFEDVPPDVDELELENFKFEFPKFITFAPEDNVIDNVYTVTEGEAVFNPNEGFHKVFTITGFDFSYMNNGYGLMTVMENGVNKIIIEDDNDVKIDGDVVVDDATLTYDDMNDILVSPKINIDPFVIKKLYGTLEPGIETVDESIDFDIGDELSFLQDDEVTLGISNPQILLSIGNTLGIPVDVTMDLYSMDAGGNMIPGSRIEETVINVKEAEVDGETTISKFLLSAQGTEMAGYETVQVENLSNLLTKIPDKIAFNMDAESDKTVTHRVDISKDMEITGDYEVIVPLQFDELNINYKDTIPNLGNNLADLYDVINDIGLKINMTIENSIPFELNLDVIPLNPSGELIPGISTSVEGSIPAGNLDEAAEEEISVYLTAEDGQLEMLDALILDINVTASETVGGAALMGDQYVMFKNIQLIIEGGLEFDMND